MGHGVDKLLAAAEVIVATGVFVADNSHEPRGESGFVGGEPIIDAGFAHEFEVFFDGEFFGFCEEQLVMPLGVVADELHEGWADVAEKPGCGLVETGEPQDIRDESPVGFFGADTGRFS